MVLVLALRHDIIHSGRESKVGNLSSNFGPDSRTHIENTLFRSIVSIYGFA